MADVADVGDGARGAEAPGPAVVTSRAPVRGSAVEDAPKLGRLLVPIRLFLVAYLLFAVGVLTLGFVAKLAASSGGLHDHLHNLGSADSLQGRSALRMADASHRAESQGQFVLDYVFSFFNIALALFMLWLRPRDRAAPLLAIGLIGTAAVFNLQAHAVYEVIPATYLEAFTHDAFHAVAVLAYFFALVIFPDGRLVPRWRRGLLIAFYVATAPVVAALAFVVRGTSRTISLVMVFGLLVPAAGVASQGYRFRRSSNVVERQQSRLLFWALLPALGVGLVALASGIQHSGSTGFEGRGIVVLPVGTYRVFQLVFSIIPVALLAGLLRFKLWSIDKVVSRALVYGLLAGFVTAVYVGVVVGVGGLIGRHQQGGLVLPVIATFLVAAAFEPVKTRTQRLANRIVYGRRATPYEVLSEFSERVAEAVATEELLSRMARILAEGTGARRADVWLNVDEELRPAASWPEDPSAIPAPLPITGPTLPWIDEVTSAVPVRHQGELLGALTVIKPSQEALTPTEEKLMADLGRQAGLVLRNVRLTADLRARLDELHASRQRLVVAQDEARRRLERNLHDGAQQELVALKVHLSIASDLAGELGDPGAQLVEMLDRLKLQTGEALENLRDLARGIYPPLLAAEGLAVALAAQGRKSSVPVLVEAEGIGRLPQETEAALYFCCLEALQNVAKYAGATHVDVRLRRENGRLQFAVEDDGAGFDTTCTLPGSGSRNMADRVEALDGEVRVESSVGGGTSVRGWVPVPIE